MWQQNKGGSQNPHEAANGTASTFAAASDRVRRMHPADEEGRMLHSPGLKANGKLYGFATGADLIVKLPAARVNDLVESGDGSPCSPRPGRPMKEWVRIAAPDADACVAYLLEAREFVAATTRSR